MSYNNIFCHWCGKSMIASEAQTGNTTQDGAILCSFCIQFPTVQVMYAWMGIIADYAISDKRVTLTSVTYDEGTGKYTINFKYNDDDMVRSGWVA